MVKRKKKTQSVNLATLQVRINAQSSDWTIRARTGGRWITKTVFTKWRPATQWFNITYWRSYQKMDGTVWPTVKTREGKKYSQINWDTERGKYSRASKQGSGGVKNKRKQVRLCSDNSLSPGNPAAANVREGKHRGLSHFKQNSRPSGWTSKRKKNKQNSVTNVKPIHICFCGATDVPHHRFSLGGAPYKTQTQRI